MKRYSRPHWIGNAGMRVTQSTVSGKIGVLEEFPMIKLSEELQRAVRANPSAPIELTDPDTHESYTLVRTEVFE